MTSLIISSSSVVEARRAEGRGEPFESAWRLPSTGRVHCSLQYFRQSSYENKSLVAGKSEIGQGLGPISEIYANRGGAKLTGFLEAFRLILDLVAQLVEQPEEGMLLVRAQPWSVLVWMAHLNSINGIMNSMLKSSR